MTLVDPSCSVDHGSGASKLPWGVRFLLVVGLSAAVARMSGSGAVTMFTTLTMGAASAGRSPSSIARRIRSVYLPPIDLTRRRQRHRSDGLLDALTHDPFRLALPVLGRQPVDRSPALVVARERVAAIDIALRSSAAERAAAATADGRRWEGWRAAVEAVKLLHSSEIERSILLFALWTRALLLAVGPALGSLTPGGALGRGGPLAVGTWLVVAGWAACTALRAPRIVEGVLERTDASRRLRTGLLAVEVPLAVTILVVQPSWITAAFAVGVTNWWQRNAGASSSPATFSWLRMCWFSAGFSAVFALSLARTGLSPEHVAGELVLGALAVLVLGSSYGAMLPLSAAVAARSCSDHLGTRRRVRRAVAPRIEECAASLHAAAAELEMEANARAADALEAARALRDSADALQRGLARWSQRAPQPLAVAELVQRALDFAAGSTGAPMTFYEPSISPRTLRGARLSKPVSEALTRVVVRCAMEARCHGADGFETLIRQDGDRIVVKCANLLGGGPSPAGRGSGLLELQAAVASLPDGSLDQRGRVDSTFVDGTGSFDVFGVTVSFSVDALTHRGRPVR